MTSDEYRRCPFCSEQIIADAIKCKHCGTMLTSTQRPGTGTTGPGSAPGTSPGDRAWAPAPLTIGSEIREYRIDALLGEGGMGSVYRAVHLHTGQLSAIKVVAGDLLRNENVRKRFLQEARLMAGMRHPNIVTLYTFFEEGGQFFLVMEYVEGRTLEDILSERPFSPEEAVRITTSVLDALHYAHSRPQPIIHRDIKPANIMLDPEGRPVLMDFGIAKAVGGEKLTRTAGVIGTYEYMSPEQVQGGEITPSTDQYAVGITLYRMLTGVVPFPQRTDTGLDCMNAHLQQTPSPIAEFREGVPPWLEAVVARALAKDPRARFPLTSDMADALRAGDTGAGGSSPPPEPEPVIDSEINVDEKTRRTGVMIAMIAGGVVVLTAILLASGVFRSPEPPSSKDHQDNRPVVTVPTERPDIVSPPRQLVTPPQMATPPPCQPSCAGRTCGDDGCGGSCGVCSGSAECRDHKCIKPEPVEKTYPRYKITASASSSDKTVVSKTGPNVTYHASNVLDGDRSTAWVEGKKGHGVGEWLKLRFDEPIRVAKLRIWSGYQKVKKDKLGDRYWINERPKGIRIQTLRGERSVTLADTQDSQEIVLDGEETRTVRINIESLYEARFPDCAISEIEVVYLVD